VQDLTVSVAEILGHPGEYRDLKLAPSLEGVATALARLSRQPIDAELRAESVVEGVLLTGHVRGMSELTCARCLTDFREPLDLEVCELFASGAADVVADEDAYEISGDEIHLEPMLRDAITLALPLNPVCRPECRGLCATCGKDLAAGDCECVEETVDPRWAELDALRAKLES
jgi:uncharacterized protein